MTWPLWLENFKSKKQWRRKERETENQETLCELLWETNGEKIRQTLFMFAPCCWVVRSLKILIGIKIFFLKKNRFRWSTSNFQFDNWQVKYRNMNLSFESITCWMEHVLVKKDNIILCTTVFHTSKKIMQVLVFCNIFVDVDTFKIFRIN